MRIHLIPSEMMTDLGYSSKLNAEWAFLCMLRDEGRRAAEAFLTTHGDGSRAALHARPRPPAARASDTMGLARHPARPGAAGLAGLPRLERAAARAGRGAAGRALFAGEPLLAHWTQTFMGSAAQFLAQFFPLFLLGALFGKLMDDSGSVDGDRRLHDRAARRTARHPGRRARRRARHLWRREPVRRLLRAGADGRRRCSAPPPSRAG